MSRLVVVTAGLSQPSSTRLLAERLADGTRRPLEAGGDQVRPSWWNCATWPTMWRTTC